MPFYSQGESCHEYAFAYNTFMAIKHRELAYAHIRQKVLLGKVPMGGRLSEEALAQEIGVSRTPVREALNQLGAEGLLKLVPNHGTFVQKLTRRDVAEMYELRAMLEGYAAGEAALRVTPEQIEQLQGLCERQHKLCGAVRDSKTKAPSARQLEQWALCDVAFHLLILHIAASPRTAKIVSDLRLMTQLCGHQWIDPKEYPRRWLYGTWADHLRIVRILKKRDAQGAREHMSRHVRGAMIGVLNYGRIDDAQDAEFDLPESVRQTIAQMEHLNALHSRHAFP